MSEIPNNLRYRPSHEWVRKADDGSFIVGITAHAQGLLGDMVFVDLPNIGRTVTVGEDVAVAESVKAASDIYTPLTGRIVEINLALADNPELINNDPYQQGWLFRLVAKDDADYQQLLDAEAYAALIAE